MRRVSSVCAVPQRKWVCLKQIQSKLMAGVALPSCPHVIISNVCNCREELVAAWRDAGRPEQGVSSREIFIQITNLSIFLLLVDKYRNLDCGSWVM